MHTRFEFAQRMLRDPELKREITQFLRDDRPRPRAIVDGGLNHLEDFTPYGLEAIVLRFGRPSLITWNGQFDPPRSSVWRDRLEPYRATIESAAHSVGRVEVRGMAGNSHLGTAWMIGGEVAVTNRHVASIFASRGNGVFPIARSSNGRPHDVFVDFLAERDNPNIHEMRVREVLFIADDDPNEPDIAFLRVEALDLPIPPPLALSSDTPVQGMVVTNIGYPAFDTRNDAADQHRIFDGIYNVKRIAPGEVTSTVGAHQFAHDCTTLGGCSGAAMLAPSTGEVVGLHFAGKEAEANWAVSAPVMSDYFERYVLGSGSFVPVVEAPQVWSSDEERQQWTDELETRAGYDPVFLGERELEVALPKPIDPTTSLDLERPTPGARRDELRYENFSLIISAERHLAMLTAVNIDGTALVRRKRAGDPWRFDPRIEVDQHLDNEIYRHNPLDRGHLVRRLAPTWGRNAKRAERDTFFWTNCAPQHAHLNQRTWLGLEDHILESARTHGLRTTVLSGPVFANNDPLYRNVRLPQAFWKLVSMAVEADGGLRLWATAYLLSQAHLVSNMEFAFGPYATYQITVGKVQRLTGIDFSALANFDPLAAAGTASATRINRFDDLTF